MNQMAPDTTVSKIVLTLLGVRKFQKELCHCEGLCSGAYWPTINELKGLISNCGSYSRLITSMSGAISF